MPFIAQLSFIRDIIAQTARPGPGITLIFPLGPQLIFRTFFFSLAGCIASLQPENWPRGPAAQSSI